MFRLAFSHGYEIHDCSFCSASFLIDHHVVTSPDYPIGLRGHLDLFEQGLARKLRFDGQAGAP
jgi:hypothetical protein